MDHGGGHAGDHSSYGGGFANFINYPKQHCTSSLIRQVVPPPFTAIDRFLWGQARPLIDPSQLTDEIDETFIPSDEGSGFSCSIRLATPKNGVVNDMIGKSLTWEEMGNYPNYEPNLGFHEGDQVIENEMVFDGKKPKGGDFAKDLIKGQWTDEEDRKLIRLVNQYGDRKWAVIADKMTRRAGKQCRERWHNHLRPDIKKDTWSEEEVRMLIEAHQKVGNKWAEIAKLIPGRTENSIKNQWNATKRRQNSSLKKKKNGTKNKESQFSLLQDYIRSKTSPNQNLASSTSTTTTTTTGSSTMIFPESTNSISNDSDPSLEITHSYDDELNFMKTLFGTTTMTTSNGSSDHVIWSKSSSMDDSLGSLGNSQGGLSLSSLTHHDHENSSMCLSNDSKDETSKTQLVLDVNHLDKDIAMPGFGDHHGWYGDGSIEPNAKKTWIW